MKGIRFALKLDTFIQGVVMLFVIAGLIACIINIDHFGLAWKSFLALGSVQVLSAIGMGLARHDVKRGAHLWYSLAYFIGFIILTPILAGLGELINYTPTLILGGLYVFGIPAFLAIRYFKMTVRDMIAVNTVRRSFWDL